MGIPEPGQKPSDRADIIVRVYNMKLEEMLDDIRSGRILGTVAVGTSKYSPYLLIFLYSKLQPNYTLSTSVYIPDPY